jgi:hypothetical protein
VPSEPTTWTEYSCKSTRICFASQLSFGHTFWHNAARDEQRRRCQKESGCGYNAAADFYDHPTNAFWERYGRRTIERLQLPAGVKEENLRFIRAENVRSVETNVLYAQAFV